jgi:hypothetical protein
VSVVGQVFGAMKIISLTESSQKVLCLCSCGNYKIVYIHNLRSGATASCGCLSRKLISERNRKHGMFGTKEYNAWAGIIQRCTNNRVKAYPRYGGRGITVCDRWIGSFETFYKDIGKAPSRRHQIERLDNDGPYSPENCAWALPEAQARNRRSSRLIQYQGESLTVAEWAQRSGVPYELLRYRLSRWSVEEALARPVNRQPRPLKDPSNRYLHRS